MKTNSSILIILLAWVWCPWANAYENFSVAVYCRAYETRRMVDLSWLDSRWQDITKQVHVDKVYLETHRDLIIVDDDTLNKAKAYFHKRGIKTAGGITLTVNERNRFETFCYSNTEHRKKVKERLRNFRIEPLTLDLYRLVREIDEEDPDLMSVEETATLLAVEEGLSAFFAPFADQFDLICLDAFAFFLLVARHSGRGGDGGDGEVAIGDGWGHALGQADRRGHDKACMRQFFRKAEANTKRDSKTSQLTNVKRDRCAGHPASL